MAVYEYFQSLSISSDNPFLQDLIYQGAMMMKKSRTMVCIYHPHCWAIQIVFSYFRFLQTMPQNVLQAIFLLDIAPTCK